MSTPTEASLADRRNALSRQLILDTSIELLESTGVASLTMRAVAKRANMSERTVFRYFATREEFLDAVAVAVRSRMALPAPPRSLDELRSLPRRLYEAFEARDGLVVAGLHSEIADRMKEAAAGTRWVAVRQLVDAHAPKRSARERRIATTNICFYLGATAWHFHRFTFKLTLEEAIEAAEAAIGLALGALSGKRGG
jgi:AcrR family transcriptional regulator